MESLSVTAHNYVHFPLPHTHTHTHTHSLRGPAAYTYSLFHPSPRNKATLAGCIYMYMILHVHGCAPTELTRDSSVLAPMPDCNSVGWESCNMVLGENEELLLVHMTVLLKRV